MDLAHTSRYWTSHIASKVRKHWSLARLGQSDGRRECIQILWKGNQALLLCEGRCYSQVEIARIVRTTVVCMPVSVPGSFAIIVGMPVRSCVSLVVGLCSSPRQHSWNCPCPS